MLDFLNKFKAVHRGYTSAVVVAAGSSVRMGADKLFLELGGKPILVHTLLALNNLACIDEIIVVTRSDKIAETASLCDQYGIDKVTKILLGGETRVQSALAGVSETNEKAELIAIHDGARPFISGEIVTEAIAQAASHMAAAPAVQVTDTIKMAENGVVADTPDRSKLYAVQTPQVFQADLIKGALSAAAMQNQEITDDCAAVEAMGVPVYLMAGSRENIKITTPLDLRIAEAILSDRRTAT